MITAEMIDVRKEALEHPKSDCSSVEMMVVHKCPNCGKFLNLYLATDGSTTWREYYCSDCNQAVAA